MDDEPIRVVGAELVEAFYPARAMPVRIPALGDARVNLYDLTLHDPNRGGLVKAVVIERCDGDDANRWWTLDFTVTVEGQPAVMSHSTEEMAAMDVLPVLRAAAVHPSVHNMQLMGA